MSSNTTGVYREQVPCPLNSSHSFWPILLKLYRCFKDGLKICMWFIQNPEIIFYHFLHVLNLDIFWDGLKMCMWFFQNPDINFCYFLDILNIDIFLILILQKSIGSRYLIPLTPPTVYGRSF